MADEVRDPPTFDDLEFNALRNALYHTARRQRLESYSRVLNLVIILAGTGTVIDVVQAWGLIPWLGIAVATIGALQLVFNFSGRASTHEVLQRRFYEVLSRIHGSVELNAPDRRAVLAELMRIYGDEPPTMRALDAVAYNEAHDALYGGTRPGSRLNIGPWQYATRHLFAYNGTEFAPKSSK